MPIKSKKKSTQAVEQNKIPIKEIPHSDDDDENGEYNEIQQILDSPSIEKLITHEMIYHNSNITIKANNTSFCQGTFKILKDPKLYRIDVDFETTQEWSVVVSSQITLLAASKFFLF